MLAWEKLLRETGSFLPRGTFETIQELSVAARDFLATYIGRRFLLLDSLGGRVQSSGPQVNL
jgi:hypothetical protein